MEANSIAYAALLGWVPVSLALFTLRPSLAVAIGVIGGYLLLPEIVRFDLPLVPKLDKHLISMLSALAGVLLFARSRMVRARPGAGLEWLALVVGLGAVATAAMNSDPLFIGPYTIPSLTLHDGFSEGLAQVLFLGLPFVIGRAVFRSSRDLTDLLSVIAVSTLCYSALILWEARMSPQLHTQLYGFHPHSFVQNYRFGGWRPQVFTLHGLVLAMWVAFAVIASLGLWRARYRAFRIPTGILTSYLALVLVACRSVSPSIYVVLIAPCMVFIQRARTQLAVAAVVMLIPFTYPLLRGLDWIPAEKLVEISAGYDQERAESLEFRFVQEKKQLDKATERLLLGWGGWGRDRIYHPSDGRDLSVIDGSWIIILGQLGLVGLVGSFGLILVPVVRARKALPFFMTNRERLQVATLGWVLCAQGLDMMPNASFAPVSLLLAGAMTGVCEGARQQAGERRRAALAMTLATNDAPEPPPDGATEPSPS